jgi:hypothetical protein
MDAEDSEVVAGDQGSLDPAYVASAPYIHHGRVVGYQSGEHAVALTQIRIVKISHLANNTPGLNAAYFHQPSGLCNAGLRIQVIRRTSLALTGTFPLDESPQLDLALNG